MIVETDFAFAVFCCLFPKFLEIVCACGFRFSHLGNFHIRSGRNICHQQISYQKMIIETVLLFVFRLFLFPKLMKYFGKYDVHRFLTFIGLA